jgi:NAD-specific glutamate dehydrogenase
VTPTGELFLGIIAFAVVVMAMIQVGAILAGIRLAKRVDQLATQLDQDIKPLLASVTALTTEAARTAALATKQVERFDRLFAEMTDRVDQTLAAAQEFVTGPARQGMAIFAGVSALIDSFRGLREASRRRQASRPAVDEEESLFIG